jgi:hypothetical protein
MAMKRIALGAAMLAALAGQASIAKPASTVTVADHPSRAAVIAVVDRFMATVTAGDTAGFEALFLPSARIYVQRRGPDGSRTFSERSAVPRVAGNAPSLPVREFYWEPVVLIQDGMAVVWTPYAFDRDGKRSHCGIDVFNLVEVGGAWRIASVMYTVEPQGCPKPDPQPPLPKPK